MVSHYYCSIVLLNLFLLTCFGHTTRFWGWLRGCACGKHVNCCIDWWKGSRLLSLERCNLWSSGACSICINTLAVASPRAQEPRTVPFLHTSLLLFPPLTFPCLQAQCTHPWRQQTNQDLCSEWVCTPTPQTYSLSLSYSPFQNGLIVARIHHWPLVSGKTGLLYVWFVLNGFQCDLAERQATPRPLDKSVAFHVGYWKIVTWMLSNDRSFQTTGSD